MKGRVPLRPEAGFELDVPATPAAVGDWPLLLPACAPAPSVPLVLGELAGVLAAGVVGGVDVGDCGVEAGVDCGVCCGAC